MSEDQKPTVDQKEKNSPQEPSNEPRKLIDMFGFGKILDKLPLHKLSARMAYCMLFDLLLLLFVLVLRASGIQVNEFPNSWDLRFIVSTTIVVFFVGLSDLWNGRRR